MNLFRRIAAHRVPKIVARVFWAKCVVTTDVQAEIKRGQN